jgi:peptide/nickel transport system substrate-binding protein
MRGRRTGRWLSLGVAASLGLLAVAATGGNASPRGTLTVAITSFQSENLDPALGLTTDRYYQGHSYEYLVGTAESGQLAPERGLATAWTASPDARVHTFQLRPNVRWHDGKPFTADDVVFTFRERYRAKDTICTFCSNIRTNVVEVKALNPTTVEFQLKDPDPSFPGVVSSRDGDLSVLPRHNFQARPDGSGYRMAGNPVGTGPWKFKEWSRGESITFTANTDYWDRGRIPAFAELTVVKRPEASTRLAMVRRGEADMAFIDAGQAREVQSAGLKVMGVEGASLTVISLAGGDKPEMLCSKRDFRKAMFLAIDMDAIVQRLFPAGTGTRFASTVFTPVALGFDPQLKPYPYDPEESKRILQRLGYDGRPVKIWEVVLSNSPETPEILQLVAGYLTAVGIRTEITPIEQARFYRDMVMQNPQRFETSHACHVHINVPFPRPFVMQNIRVSFVSRPGGGVLAYYPEYDWADREYARLRQITTLKELDQELRKFNRASHEAYGFYPVVARSLAFAVGPKIASWSPGKYGLAWHLETVKPAP